METVVTVVSDRSCRVRDLFDTILDRVLTETDEARISLYRIVLRCPFRTILAHYHIPYRNFVTFRTLFQYHVIPWCALLVELCRGHRSKPVINQISLSFRFFKETLVRQSWTRCPPRITPDVWFGQSCKVNGSIRSSRSGVGNLWPSSNNYAGLYT